MGRTKNVSNKQYPRSIKRDAVIDFRKMGIVPMEIDVSLYTATIAVRGWSIERR